MSSTTWLLTSVIHFQSDNPEERMSRHRHVPQLVADAYDEIDDYDEYDDNYDDDEQLSGAVVGEDVEQYIWRGPSQQHEASSSRNIRQQEQKQREENELLGILVKDVRDVLQDDSLSRQEIDRELIAADYNPEVAIAALLDKRQGKKDESGLGDTRDSRGDGRGIELRNPSQIGRIIDEEDVIGNGRVAQNFFPELEGGRGVGSVAQFKFDVPSPDDVILARKQKGKNRTEKLRLPGPSTRKAGKTGTTKSKVAPKEENPGTVKERRKLLNADPGNVTKKLEDLSISGPSTIEKDSPNGQDSNMNMPKVKQRAKVINLSTGNDTKPKSLTVVVAGHVDAGKSTFIGHLLHRTGGIGQSRKRGVENLAWITDEDAIERERGVTIDISTKILTLPRSGGTLIMIDSPGHRDFVPAMILGASQASAAILVVDSSLGEFEAGFSEQGQTREHTILLRALGITKLIVVVNKMDTTNFAKARFDEIKGSMDAFLKTTGYNVNKNVSFVPCSATNGINLVDSLDPSHPLGSWYRGKTVVETVEALAESSSRVDTVAKDKPTRFIVSDAYRSKTLGGNIALTGRVVCGSVAVKDNLFILPGHEVARVKAIEASGERKVVVVAGVDNEPVSISLQVESDLTHVDAGAVLCDPESPVPLTTSFQARIVIFNVDRPIMQGTKAVLHLAGGSEAAVIAKLIRTADKDTAEPKKKRKRPRRLVKGDSAVVEIKTARPLCLETYSDVRPLGRFTLRDRNRTIGAGVVVGVTKSE